MDSEIKSELLNQDEPKSETDEGKEPVVDGDAMATVEPDRIENTEDLNKAYSVNTDVSASYSYAHRFNVETGQNENLRDDYGSYIDSNSGGTKEEKAERTKWLNKKYEPKEGVVAGKDEPAPAIEDLVILGQGTVAKSVSGTPENPNVFKKVLPNSLFIDGKADENDIRQGNVGDCYFLASLFQYIHYDPYFFPKIMTNHGDEVYVELCHMESDGEKGEHWVRKPIAVKWGENLQGTKGGKSFTHVGANYRIKYEPENEVKWQASFLGSTLKITKNQYYQAAMWVHILERAYADYTKIYGHNGIGNHQKHYGESVSCKDNDRYNNIEGGQGHDSLRLLYGDDVADPSQLRQNTFNGETDANTSNLLDSTNGMLDNLVTLSQLQSGAKADQIHVTTFCYPDRLWPRVICYAQRLKDSVDAHMNKFPGAEGSDELGSAVSALDAMITDVKAFRALDKNDPESKAMSKQAELTISDSMTRLAANKSFQALDLKDYISLCACTGSLIAKPGSQIYLVQCHEYNIREVHFIDKEGNEIDADTLYAYYVDGQLDENYKPEGKGDDAIEPADSEPKKEEGEEKEEKKNFWQKLFGKKDKKDKNDNNNATTPNPPKPVIEHHVEYKINMAKMKELIDVDKSYAVIQNPHATNKAVYAGQTEAQRNVGAWTTSLRELFAGVTAYGAVIIKNGDHSATGQGDLKPTNGIGGASTDNQHR